jgi:Amt family ammonium transporter
LAVALCATPEAWNNGHTFLQQLGVQTLGSFVCFAWAFGGGYSVLSLLNHLMPLRVSPRAEVDGLNFSEHGESTDLVDLMHQMRRHRREGKFRRRVHVEPYTEVGQIAAEYNRVLTRVSHEIEGREKAATALREAEAKYRSIYENAFEGIFQTTPDGRYLSANPALARMYGYDTPEALMASVGDIERQLYVEPGRRDEFIKLMQAHDVVTNFESQIFRRDGEVIWISENARAVRDAQGELLYYEGTVEDISERMQAEAWQRQVKDAEAANRAKSEFLSKMSHEIRTPLNGVIGMLDLLSATGTSPQQDRYIHIAKSSADSLLQLINDILDFSKIEAGKLELEKIEFDLPLLLEDVAEMFVHRAKSKGLELTCRILPDVPRRVLGDCERLRQILSNLLSNAIKFTSRGEIELQAETVRIGDDGAAVKIKVRDSGIGIPENRRDRLFNSFSQVDASTTRKYGGTGLGLAICKQLAELMGGTMGVDSEVGVGSTFWAVLPLPVVSHSEGAPRLPQELCELRVLAVDDVETNLDILRDQFQNWGLSLTTVSSAAEALQQMQAAAAEERPYGLAILDCVMPETDGLQLAEQIRRDQQICETPLLMLTSLDSTLAEPVVSRLKLAGCLTKPIRQSRLYDALVDAVSDRAPTRPIIAEQAPPAVSTPAEFAGRRVVITDDNEINQLVATETLRGLGFETATAGNGREAVEAVQREAYDVVLMDCEMPELDGFAATGAIRRWEAESKQSRRLPIIALTANAVQGDRERCLAAGMNAYVSKPIDRTLLLAALRQCLAGTPTVGVVHEQNRLTAGPTARANAVSIKPDIAISPASCDQELPIDVATLLDRCVGDKAFVAKILDKFGRRVGSDVDALRAAIEASDLAAVTRFAHTMKGSAANVSAVALSAACGVLEKEARAGELTAAPERLASIGAELDRFFDALIETLEALKA